MAFGMHVAKSGDFVDRMTFDARAGRVFLIDYNQDTRERQQVDITMPAPKFAIDFGGLQVGYASFGPAGPEWRVVPEGQPLPSHPPDKDDKGKLAFKPVFRVLVYGRVLNGVREFSSSAGCVLESVEDLYRKFRDAPEAATGQVPIVELVKSIPIAVGRGERRSTVYSPCWRIAGWCDRPKEFGNRTVAPPAAPKSSNGGAAPPPPVMQMGPNAADVVAIPTAAFADDAIPF